LRVCTYLVTQLTLANQLTDQLTDRTTNRPTNRLTDQPPANRPTTEELNYSGDRAWRCLRTTNNLLEVWKNLAIFGSRPIWAAIEALLTKVSNQQSSY
jgi:hypothetical protein